MCFLDGVIAARDRRCLRGGEVEGREAGAEPGCCATVSWAERFGTQDEDSGGIRALAFDGRGEITLASTTTPSGGGGISTGRTDGMSLEVVHFDAGGDPRWSHLFGERAAVDVAVDAEGNSVVVGFGSSSTSWPNWTLLAAKLDADGDLQWQLDSADEEYAWADGVAIDAAGNVFITGTFSGDLEFGSHTLTSAGSSGQPDRERSDIYVARLAP